MRYLALSDRNLSDFNAATPFRTVERDVARRVEEFYPQYRSISFDQLESLPRAYLVAFRERKSTDWGHQFDGFEVSPLRPQLYELVNRSARDAK